MTATGGLGGDPPTAPATRARAPARYVAAALCAVTGSWLLAHAGAAGPPAPPPGAAAAGLGGGTGGAALAPDRPTPRDPPAPRPALRTRPGAAPAELPRSAPAWLRIDRIGVSTPLVELGLAPDGTPQVPPLERDAPAGWIGALATPGERGAAVLLGHVDSAQDGPAVFYRLGDLRPGDRVLVDRSDGLQARFAVTSVVLVTKAQFPSSAVYGRADGPVLRLVTCGGAFDRRRRTYTGSVIVFASLVGTGTAR